MIHMISYIRYVTSVLHSSEPHRAVANGSDVPPASIASSPSAATIFKNMHASVLARTSTVSRGGGGGGGGGKRKRSASRYIARARRYTFAHRSYPSPTAAAMRRSADRRRASMSALAFIAAIEPSSTSSASFVRGPSLHLRTDWLASPHLDVSGTVIG